MVAWRGSKHNYYHKQNRLIIKKKDRNLDPSIHPSRRRRGRGWAAAAKMDDDVVQRVLEGGGRDCSFLPHPFSILRSLSLHVVCLLLLFSILIFLKFLSIDQSSPGANFLGNIEFFLFLCWRGSLRMHI